MENGADKVVNIALTEQGAAYLRKLLVQQQDQLVQIAFTIPELGDLQGETLLQIETMLVQLEVHQTHATIQ